MTADPKASCLLRETECFVEHSGRKPRTVIGVIFCGIGLWAVFEPVLLLFRYSELVVSFIIGLILLYAAMWILLISRREYVCVTNERLIYQKVNLIGKSGKTLSFQLQDISKARLGRSMTSYRQKEQSGHVVLIMTSGKVRVLPCLKNGMFIVEAIREECKKLSGSQAK